MNSLPLDPDFAQTKNKHNEPLRLFDINPLSLHDLFREFDLAMETPEERRQKFRLVRMEEPA